MTRLWAAAIRPMIMKTDANDYSETRGIRLVFRALRSRNYRLFFGGQSVSLIGTWVMRIAMSWLVYRLTNSALLLGVVGFADRIPTFVLAPLAGALGDRWSRHKILIIAHSLFMVNSLALAALALTGVIQVWHIIALSIFHGMVAAFDMPARHAFVVEMVERKEDLPNAIALNSFMFNGARLIGPSIAGILIAWVGEGVCFLLDGVSFLPVIAALLAMTVTVRTRDQAQGAVLEGLREGLVYAVASRPIRALLLLVGLMSLVGLPYAVLMPVFAKDILQGGPDTLGFLMAAAGVGALVGAIYLAARASVRGLGKVIVTATCVFGMSLVVFSLSRTIWFSLLMMFAAGWGMMVAMASCNTVVQTIVADDKRGRVMSFYIMAFTGALPLGSLLAGFMATKIGAPNTLGVGGAICVAAAVWSAWKLPGLRRIVQPIYEGKGISPSQ